MIFLKEFFEKVDFEKNYPVGKELMQYGPRRQKTCLQGFVNNKGADQPAHPCSLTSAFVIRLLKSIITKFATSEFSVLKLVSLAEETALNLALLDTPKTGFLTSQPI